MAAENSTQSTLKGTAKVRVSKPLEKEITRLLRLREDVLLLRFFLSRRMDTTDLISDRDRLISEAALKSSLEIVETLDIDREGISIQYSEGADSYTARVSASASALMHSVEVLVKAARLSAERDATDEVPPPITPESLRASLPAKDVADALGENQKEVKSRLAADRASKFILRKVFWAIICFLAALAYHFMITSHLSTPKIDTSSWLGFVSFLLIPSADMSLGIMISAFLWAMTGSHIWILIRFRTFGANYAFDPAQARVFQARVYSGAITSAILLYFVFGGGTNAWAQNWELNLPLWAFVLGYAGRLQVEFLRAMVERVEDAIRTVLPSRRAQPESPKKDSKNASSAGKEKPGGK